MRFGAVGHEKHSDCRLTMSECGKSHWIQTFGFMFSSCALFVQSKVKAPAGVGAEESRHWGPRLWPKSLSSLFISIVCWMVQHPSDNESYELGPRSNYWASSLATTMKHLLWSFYFHVQLHATTAVPPPTHSWVKTNYVQRLVPCHRTTNTWTSDPNCFWFPDLLVPSSPFRKWWSLILVPISEAVW